MDEDADDDASDDAIDAETDDTVDGDGLALGTTTAGVSW